MTGIASRKDLSPRNNKPGVFTNIYKIKSEIQAQLGNCFFVFLKRNQENFFKLYGRIGPIVLVSVLVLGEKFVKKTKNVKVELRF